MTQPDIPPFNFTASDEALAELRRRIVATEWPERETVTDASQGVQLATMQALARHWATECLRPPLWTIRQVLVREEPRWSRSSRDFS
jgi:hypothetical protein